MWWQIYVAFSGYTLYVVSQSSSLLQLFMKQKITNIKYIIKSTFVQSNS